MGFMNVFVFLIITAEVHIHTKIPKNRIPKAPQARNCYEKTKKERLRFLFLVTFLFLFLVSFFFLVPSLWVCLWSRHLLLYKHTTSIERP